MAAPLAALDAIGGLVGATPLPNLYFYQFHLGFLKIFQKNFKQICKVHVLVSNMNFLFSYFSNCIKHSLALSLATKVEHHFLYQKSFPKHDVFAKGSALLILT